VTEYTNIKLRQLLESDADIRKALIQLRAQPEDIALWGKALQVTKSHHKELHLYLRLTNSVSGEPRIIKDVDSKGRGHLLYTVGMWHGSMFLSSAIRHGIRSIDIV